MSDYEATAYLSLEKLKEKHMLEFEQFQDRTRKELRAKMKFSNRHLPLKRRIKGENTLNPKKNPSEMMDFLFLWLYLYYG